MNTKDIAPAANLLARATAIYASFENLLIAELVAGNAIAGTPMAACGRVVLGMACTFARSLTVQSLCLTSTFAKLAQI